jgi:hypothetical protein
VIRFCGDATLDPPVAWRSAYARSCPWTRPSRVSILDLVEWIGPTPRRYAEVLEAWRTSCPRLPVWEEAHNRGFIKRDPASGSGFITVSGAGRRHLSSHRLMPA